MRFRTTFVSALLGLSGLVMPTLAFSAADADSLYELMMRQPYEDRVQTLKNLDAAEKTLVLVSRINQYRDTHSLNEGQSGFLDKVIEQIKQDDDISPDLLAESDQFFDFDAFKQLTSTLRDMDNIKPVSTNSAKLRKRAPDCNCSTGNAECGSGRVCVGSADKTCAFLPERECGHWWQSDYWCDGKCYTR